MGSFSDFSTKSCTKGSFHTFILPTAGSVVQQDLTERLHLMSGHRSPVKTKNVVPHDIGDPGKRRATAEASRVQK